MLYLLDANVLIDADRDYYGIGRVPQFWSWLHHHAVEGRVKIASENFDEVAGGGAPRPGDLLVPYLRRPEVRRALVLAEEVNRDLVNTVLARAYGGPNPDEEALEIMGQDPFLIAYGLADPVRRTVVSVETSKPTWVGPKRKVPDACADVGVPFMRPFDFFRTLDFSVDWEERQQGQQP